MEYWGLHAHDSESVSRKLQMVSHFSMGSFSQFPVFSSINCASCLGGDHVYHCQLTANGSFLPQDFLGILMRSNDLVWLCGPLSVFGRSRTLEPFLSMFDWC